MTDAPDYDAIEARVNAATEGPWLTDAGVDGDGWVFVGNRSDGREFGLWEIVHSSSDPLRDLTPEAARREVADAEFIAHVRTDIPALIASTRDLQDDLRAARVTIARIEAFERLLACDRGSTTCEDIAGRLRYELGRDPRP